MILENEVHDVNKKKRNHRRRAPFSLLLPGLCYKDLSNAGMSTIAETQFNGSPTSSSIEVNSDDASKCNKSYRVHFNVAYQTSEFLHRMNFTLVETVTLTESSY